MMFRWPDELEGVDWDYGVPKSYIKVGLAHLLTTSISSSSISDVPCEMDQHHKGTHFSSEPCGCHSCASSQNQVHATRRRNSPWSIHGGEALLALQELAHYWETSFDWRQAESMINTFANYEMDVNGIAVSTLPYPFKCLELTSERQSLQIYKLCSMCVTEQQVLCAACVFSHGLGVEFPEKSQHAARNLLIFVTS